MVKIPAYKRKATPKSGVKISLGQKMCGKICTGQIKALTLHRNKE